MNPEDDVHLLTGAYALDAVEQREARQFERHLVLCASCRDEVADLRQTVGLLAAGTARPAPEHLFARVMEQVVQSGKATAPYTERIPTKPPPGSHRRPD